MHRRHQWWHTDKLSGFGALRPADRHAHGSAGGASEHDLCRGGSSPTDSPPTTRQRRPSLLRIAVATGTLTAARCG